MPTKLHKYQVDIRKVTDFWGEESDILWTSEEVWAEDARQAFSKVVTAFCRTHDGFKKEFFNNMYTEIRRIS